MTNLNFIRKSILILIILIFSVTCFSQTFTEKTVITTNISNLSEVWGDYDNDGYLDVLLMGLINVKSVSKIYHNNGDGTFTEKTDINIVGVYDGSAAWGDYDNDGYLDLLLTTGNPENYSEITKIYHNDGGTGFTEQSNISLTGVKYSSVAWGDYDNDGFLDILLTGSNLTKIYRNDRNNNFTEQTEISLIGVNWGSVAWGDYDNDGDLDILLTGSGYNNNVTKIYRNNGDNSFTEQNNFLPGIIHSSVAWGDYDNDGFLDIVLTGSNISKIYKNNGNNTFTEQTGISLTGVINGNASWGDYDNDGSLDILISGKTNGSSFVNKIYRNNGDQTFTDKKNISSFDGVSIWADCDNDGDLDIITYGSGITKIYYNNSTVKNQIPEAPTGIEQNITGNNVILKWKPVTTDATPAKGLSYNVRVGTTSTSINTLSPQASITGLRRITAIGNCQLDTLSYLKNLNIGTYYWSVQAIDNCYKGGKFSEEGSFTIIEKKPASGLLISKFEGSYGTIKWNRGNLGKCIVFVSEGTETCVPQNNTSYIASSIFGQGTNAGKGCYCVYNGVSDNVKVTGLKGLTEYTVQVFEYMDLEHHEEYLTTGLTDNVKSFTTLPFTFQYDLSVKPENVDLGDYDNDGYLDILLTYRYNGMSMGDHGVLKIYRNNGNNTFTEQTQIQISGIYNGSVKWGDYNNDGYLDILESGELKTFKSDTKNTTLIYKNNGNGTFTAQNSIKLPALNRSFVVWGDYNNDGYLDFLLTGSGASNIYRNNGNNTFTKKITLSGVSNGSAAWGDYNNDGYLDIVITGSNISKIYKNNGNSTFTEQKGISLTGVSNSSVAWGDYDNDGFSDILLTGKNAENIDISKIYRNNGNNTFTEQTSISLTGVADGSAIWGDYNKDGYLDILLSGLNITSGIYTFHTKIYQNNQNNSFTELLNLVLPNVNVLCINWGDIDNDNDLDIILNGKIYQNDIQVEDLIPHNAPGDLKHIVKNNNVTLSWKSDSQTDSNQKVSYNLKVFNKTKSKEVLPSNSADDGFRKVVSIGNVGLSTTYTLKNLKPGTYHWQVQSVENNFKGGSFSAKDTFVINYTTQSTALTVTEIDGASALIKWERGNLDKSIVFMKEGKGTLTPTNNYTYAASDIFKKGSATDDGWFCVYNGNGESVKVIGINGLTDYTVVVFEYEGDKGFEQYLTTISSKNSASFKTSNFSVQLDIILSPAYETCSSWGDYDNDGFLDILVTGKNDISYNSISKSKIYHNNGDNTFTEQTGISLAGVSGSPGAWGDYNNDGYLDILLNGSKSIIYKNNGDNTFTEQTNILLSPVSDGSGTWGDYDNDGYLDILLVGFNSSIKSGISKIYRNNGDNTFSEQTSILLKAISSGSGIWGDYNNDGNLDILLYGISDNGNSYICEIYKNNGDNTFTEYSAAKIAGLYNSTGAWCDFNNDGYQDVVISGEPLSGNDYITKIYKNNESVSFSKQIWSFFPSTYHKSVAVCDYDNDGDMDILLSGNSIVYKNINNFMFKCQSDLKFNFGGSESISSGDYDNDGDLDILLGNQIYRNYLTSIKEQKPNKKPLSPKDLSTKKLDYEYLLSWNGDDTDETPLKSLSYNVEIAQDKSYFSMDSSQNNEAIHKVVSSVNSGLNNFYKVRLRTGNYYWRVRAVDGGFKCGDWSHIDSIGVNQVFPYQPDIYPNPVSTILTIITNNKDESTQLNIYTIDGIELYNAILVNDKTDIDFSSYKNGIYLLKISSRGNAIMRKIIKT